MRIQTRKEYTQGLARLRELRRKYIRDKKNLIDFKERAKDQKEYGDLYVAIGEYEHTQGIAPKELNVRLLS